MVQQSRRIGSKLIVGDHAKITGNLRLKGDAIISDTINFDTEITEDMLQGDSVNVRLNQASLKFEVNSTIEDDACFCFYVVSVGNVTLPYTIATGENMPEGVENLFHYDFNSYDVVRVGNEIKIQSK